MALCLHCFSHLKAPVMFSASEDDNEELGEPGSLMSVMCPGGQVV